MPNDTDTNAEAVVRSIHLRKLRTALTYWRPPFTYHSEGAIITDAKGSRILDIRGWGHLTGRGSEARALPERVAEVIQDDIGEALAYFLNNPE